MRENQDGISLYSKNNKKLPNEAIFEFMRIYYEKNGELLSYKEACKKASELMEKFLLAY